MYCKLQTDFPYFATNMIQRIVDIRTDGILAFNKETRQLIICLADYSITIALADKQNNHWISVEVLQFIKEDMRDIDELMQNLKQQSVLLNYTGMDVKFYICTSEVMAIPTHLENNVKELLQLQYGLKTSDLTITEFVNTEIIIALKANIDWISMFTNLFPHATLYSSLGTLVKQSLEDHQNNVLSTMQLVFCNNLIEIVVVKNDQLLIAKCFRYQMVEDMIYQLLNICKQLYINPSEVVIKVQGLIQNASPLYESLLKYFINVQLKDADTNEWGVLFKTIPAHYFTNLINASS